MRGARAAAAQTAVANLGPGRSVQHKAGSKIVIVTVGDEAETLVDALGG